MRRFGIAPATAAEQFSRTILQLPTEAFEPLPGSGSYDFSKDLGAQGVLDLGTVRTDPANQLRFYVLGDTGGVKDPNPQQAVANAMVADAAEFQPHFGYIVGDVDYFNGDMASYPSQFGEPYAHLNIPLFAIPGNHDGDISDDSPTNPRQPLDGFMAHFCSKDPVILPGEEEYNRDTMTQPYCYWTLDCSLATIIGLYSNVPSGGVIHEGQVQWLEAQLAAAPRDRALIVALHHPPYSADAHHGGSAAMGDLLDAAFLSANHWPQLVLSGHVHNYQRFDRLGGASGWTPTYIVAGNGGYHNLHSMAPGISGLPWQTPDDGTVLSAYDDKNWGFLKFTLDAKQISGEYISVSGEGLASSKDGFTVTL